SFAQADGSQLSHKWLGRSGNFSDVSNEMVGTGTLNLATVNGTVGNTAVQADVTIGLNQYAQLVARYNASTGSTYFASFYDVSGKNYLAMYQFNGGVYTLLAGPTLVAASSGTM